MALILIALIALSAVVTAERVLITPNEGIKAGELLGGFLKARHFFGNSFTIDLQESEIRALGKFAKVEAVPVLYILGKEEKGFTAERINGKRSTGRTYIPADQTPYGIEQIYNNPAITTTTGGSGIDIAILDTGVYKSHLDLKRRVKQCVDFSQGKAFGTTIKVGTCTDGHGHGTHVASTALADGGADGKGIYGVAPQANLFAYKVLSNSGSGYEDDIATAVRYAADQGAEIVSMSLGANSPLTLLGDAIDYATGKGVLVVAAAGNDGPAEGTIDYPGAHPNAVAVAAIDSAKAVAGFSSRGITDNDDTTIIAREVEMSAAGVSVLGAYKDGGYRQFSGTSMATPHIAGLAAKVWQGNGAATRAYIKSLAEDITAGTSAGTGYDIASGYGLGHSS